MDVGPNSSERFATWRRRFAEALVRSNLLCLLVTVAIPCCSLARPRVEPIDYVAELKRFVENPPIVKSLVVCCDWGGLGSYPTNCFEFRYQPGAVWIKKADKLDWLPGLTTGPPTILGCGVSYAGCCNKTFWVLDRHGGMNISLFTEDAFRNWTSTNIWFNWAGGSTFDSEFCLAYYVMNMGIPYPKFGGLHWVGNRTSGTTEWGAPFVAELVITNGRPAGVRIHHEINPLSPFGGRPGDTFIPYEYDDAIPNWPLPTRIQRGNLTMAILRARFMRRPQAEWHFNAWPILNHHSHLATIHYWTNTLRPYSDKTITDRGFDEQEFGMTRVLWWWLPKAEVKRLYFVVVCVMTASVVAAGAAMAGKKPTKIQNTEIT